MSDDFQTTPAPPTPVTGETTPAPPAPVTGASLPEPPARRDRSFGVALVTALVTALVVAALTGAAAGFLGARLATGGTAATVSVVGQTDEPIAAAAAAALPSVVNIDVTGSSTASNSALPHGHPSVPIGGTGSGIAYKTTSDGGTYIITNDHVIQGASSIVVTALDGERRKATFVGGDPDTDVAVVKIAAKVPVIKVADSSKLMPGDTTVGIGSPFGLEHSVSAGVVSALHRSLPPSSADTSGVSSLVDVIQTDAAINPGNSGGALVDRRGRLIGVNAAIYTGTGVNDGIGFAIPSNTAVRVAEELISTGHVRHPFLGIEGSTVTEAQAKTLKVPVTEGALIARVFTGTGAEKAGLKRDDLIVSLNDTPIRSMDDLVLTVRRMAVGDKAVLKVYRNGTLITLDMIVGDKPAVLK